MGLCGARRAKSQSSLRCGVATSNESIPSAQNKNLLDRFLSLFSVVKSGEGGSAILLTLNVFLLLGAYYFLKISRDTLILAESGAAAAS